MKSVRSAVIVAEVAAGAEDSAVALAAAEVARPFVAAMTAAEKDAAALAAVAVSKARVIVVAGVMSAVADVILKDRSASLFPRTSS